MRIFVIVDKEYHYVGYEVSYHYTKRHIKQNDLLYLKVDDSVLVDRNAGIDRINDSLKNRKSWGKYKNVCCKKRDSNTWYWI